MYRIIWSNWYVILKTYKYISIMRIVFVSVLFVVKMYKFFGHATLWKNNTRVSQVNDRYKMWPLSCFLHFQWFKIEVALEGNNRLKSKNMFVCITRMRAMNTSSLSTCYILSFILCCLIVHFHIRCIPSSCDLAAVFLRFCNNNMGASIFLVNLCNVMLQRNF